MAKRAAGKSKSADAKARPATKRPAKAPAGKKPVRARKIQQAALRNRETPLDRAQRLMEQAMQHDNPERQIDLAQRALDLSPDCADAYTLLSRFLADRRQSLLLLLEGIKAADRVLGAERRKELVGHYWLAEETRPYMRARLALAECLWALGQRSESVLHMQALLELNPHDSQGVRYALAAHLLELNQDAEFDKLFRKYDDDSALLRFSQLLREFRRSGDAPATRRLLKEANACNPHVIALLLGSEQMPEEVPEMYSMGSAAEAVMYVLELGHAWRQTPGAITWLRQVTATPSPQNPRGRSLTAADRKQIAKVPQRVETVWQVAVDSLPTWLNESGHMIRPWSVLVIDATDEKILEQQVYPAAPDAGLLIDCIREAICNPKFGKPHRPREVQLHDSPAVGAVSTALEALGIDCVTRKDLRPADEILLDLQEQVGSEQPPALVASENFNSSRGAGVFRAATEYYRRAPWNRAPSDSVIQIDCPQMSEFGTGTWYAVILGQSGQSYGLALHSNLDDLRSITGGCCSGQGECGFQGTALSIQFGEAWEIPIEDLVAAEKHRWELAGPEAYPLVVATDDGVDVRVLQAWELHLAEAVLLALPDFVEQHGYSKPRQDPVPVSFARLKFRLSWVEPETGGCGSDCGSCDHDHDHDH